MPLVVIGANHSRLLQTEATDRVDENALQLVLDAGLVVAFVQQQTMGVVAPLAALDPERKPTETDATLSASVLNDALGRTEKPVEAVADKECISGFQFGARAVTARSLTLGFVADRYRVFDLLIDIRAGTSKGSLTPMFPEPAPRPVVQAAPAPPDGRSNPMLDLPTELQAVLTVLRLPLGTVGGWQEGDVVPMPVGTDWHIPNCFATLPLSCRTAKENGHGPHRTGFA